MSRMNVNIFDFTCPKDFIAAFVGELKRRDPEFSFRRLSKSCGFKSSATFKNIIDGRSGISLEGAKKIALGFGLNVAELKFLLKLVRYVQEKSPAVKKRILDEIMGDQTYASRHPLAPAQYRYYTEWYYPLIREVVVAGAMNADQIQERLLWPISVEQVHVALADLCALKLVREESGFYFPTAEVVVSAPEINGLSPLIVSYQEQMIGRGIEALSRFSKEERDFRSLTLNMDPEAFAKFKLALQDFLHFAIKKFESQSQSKNLTVQLNLQAFPLARRI